MHAIIGIIIGFCSFVFNEQPKAINVIDVPLREISVISGRLHAVNFVNNTTIIAAHDNGAETFSLDGKSLYTFVLF